MTHAKNEIGIRDRLAGGARALSGFLANQTGASFVVTALAFPVILGMAGIGVDAVLWYMDKRQNQTIADNGAVAGTIALSRDGNISLSDLKQAVWASTASNGFTNGTDGTVVVNKPPQSGPNAGDDGFVEVIVQEPATLYFSRWMRGGRPFNVQSRAVGGVSYFGEHCVVALDPTADAAINVIGTADVTSDCGLAANSNSDQAILVQGKAHLSALPLQAYGDIDKDGAATWDSEYPPQPLSERVDDPYAGILTGLQADPTCAGAPTPPPTTSGTLAPGRYCGGILINGNVDFAPGLFILDDGGLKISGGGDIRGPGGTFILTAMDASDLGSFDLSGGGLVELRSPTAAEAAATGGYEGMLMIQDPYVPNLDTANLETNMLTGSTNMVLSGALYFPDMHTEYAGGAGGQASCTLIVSKTVTFTGTTSLVNDEQACLEAGVTSGIQQTRVRLFE